MYKRSNLPEVYISVDTETTGLDFTKHSIVSIGAVVINMDSQESPTFYTELQPLPEREVTPKAMETNGLVLKELIEKGVDPKTGLQKFREWVKEQQDVETPIAVIQKSVFDWGFLEEYFRLFKVRNPFYHAPIDLKSMAFVANQIPFRETSSVFNMELETNHNALDDAITQAKLFKRILQG